MWKNYLKTSYRTLTRNKNYTLLNISGLSIGIAVFLVIFMIIRFETGYDQFHKNKDRIYRVLTVYKNNKYGVNITSGVPAPLPAALQNDFPDVKVTDISAYPSFPVSVLKEDGQIAKSLKTDLFFTEPSFFDIFDFGWAAGNAKASLNDPNTAVLTKKTATLFFGDWNKAIGKIIRVNNDFTLKVTGVLNDVPEQTDFQFKVILPISLLKHAKSTNWTTITGQQQCYLLLPPGMKVSTFDEQLKSFSRKYRAADDKTIQALQPLAKVHYDAKNEYEGVGNFSGKIISGQKVGLLWLIAAFILIIACVNFINLATAQAVNRAKEIGVRKVMGSNKAQLIIQFLTEVFLLVLTAVIMAIVLVLFLTEGIGHIINMPITLAGIPLSTLLSFLVVLTVTVTILAGLYPALVLSGFNPIKALKNKAMAARSQGLQLRPVLVVFQFVIAQVLIISTIIIIRQMNYFEKGSMGFEKDAVINIAFKPDSVRNSRLNYLQNKLLTVKGIKHVSFNNTSPAEEDSWWTPIVFDHAMKPTEFPIVSKYADANYVSTYHLQIVAGRNINPAAGTKEFLVNETLVKKLGFKRPYEVLNKEINMWSGFARGPVVGVVKDFHTASFKEGIAPVFFVNQRSNYANAGIELATTDMPGTILAIQKIWTEAYPDAPFDYQFLSDKIANFYKQEKQLSALFQMFAGIAIFLGCLGLYGLASFMAAQRVKEIGIRKVLGATSVHIIYLFSRDFVRLVIIAFLIASPIAWYFMQQWLQQYTYHISVGSWIFLAGGLGSVIIALTTISFKALSASFANPAKSLKSE
ncbi:ABC transporter permease [Mucilaginibacter sp.]|jgi:predicted permease|uniref:ABC transporter permease n=1 Tax=Mucilaginibacter sp. TaxID=1882438 RepID=UPI00356AA497